MHCVVELAWSWSHKFDEWEKKAEDKEEEDADHWVRTQEEVPSLFLPGSWQKSTYRVLRTDSQPIKRGSTHVASVRPWTAGVSEQSKHGMHGDGHDTGRHSDAFCLIVPIVHHQFLSDSPNDSARSHEDHLVNPSQQHLPALRLAAFTTH